MIDLDEQSRNDWVVNEAIARMTMLTPTPGASRPPPVALNRLRAATFFLVTLAIASCTPQAERTEKKDLEKRGVSLSYSSEMGGFIAKFVGKDLGDEECKLLHSLGNVAAIHANDCGITDEVGMKLLADMPLKELYLTGLHPVTHRGIAHLQNHPRLEFVAIKLVHSGDRVAEFLATIPRLSFVDLQGGGLTEKGTKALATLDRLESCSVSDFDGSNAAIIHLRGCKSLKNLRLIRAQGQLDVRELLQLRRLNRLELEHSALTQTGEGCREYVSPAQHVAIRHCICDTGFFFATCFPKALSLDLCGSNVTDFDLDHFGALRSLATLNLNETQITDAAVPTLAKVSSLTHLHLRGSTLTRDGREAFRKSLPRLMLHD